MSSHYFRTVKCAICGGAAEQMGLASSNTFGGTPDLDMRPAQMLRSTMCWWIQECPHCGYTADDLDDPTGVSREWIESEEYRTCQGNRFASELAVQFYRSYMIKKADGKFVEAYYAVLHAAWACDDAGEEDLAVVCRLKALELFEVIEPQHKTEEDYLVKMDLLRRSGRFADLEKEFATRSFSGEDHGKIAAFQLEKARQGDTACYRVGHALGIQEWD